MGERFQSGEPEEPAASFQGVNGAEDTRQDLPVSRPLLQRNEVLIDALQVFEAFTDKLGNEGCHQGISVIRRKAG